MSCKIFFYQFLLFGGRPPALAVPGVLYVPLGALFFAWIFGHTVGKVPLSVDSHILSIARNYWQNGRMEALR